MGAMTIMVDGGLDGGEGNPFRLRDAVAERDDVATDLLIEGEDRTPPLMTIGVTTYRRPHHLVEAVRSALNQQFDRPWEIVVVDDDPQSDSAERLLAALPILRTSNFRYYRQQRNLGIYHNFNRVLRFARGEWMTVLNDDDLLDPDYLQRMFAELDAHPEIDGLIPHKHVLDERDGAPAGVEPVAQGRSGGGRFGAAVRLLRREGVGAVAKAAATLAQTRALYGGRQSRRIPVRKLFWGSILGTCCGFVYRRENALAIGGFHQDETPAADFFFYVRYAKFFRLHQYRFATVTMRKAANETAKRDNVIRSFRNAHAVQRAVAAGDAPAWWLKRLTPLILAWHRADFRDQWRVELSAAEIEEATGVRIGRERPRLIWALRLLLRGF